MQAGGWAALFSAPAPPAANTHCLRSDGQAHPIPTQMQLPLKWRLIPRSCFSPESMATTPVKPKGTSKPCPAPAASCARRNGLNMQGGRAVGWSLGQGGLGGAGALGGARHDAHSLCTKLSAWQDTNRVWVLRLHREPRHLPHRSGWGCGGGLGQAGGPRPSVTTNNSWQMLSKAEQWPWCWD